MGNSTSLLSPQSQPGSALQNCLSNAFPKDSVTFPQHMDYMSKTKLYNLDVPVHPAAVVRPSTSEQVSAAVKCAIEANVKVQPRSGGHSFANYGTGGVDGALMVDLVNLQKFSMDTNSWQATIGSGTLLGDVTKRLHDNGGRAIAHGTCPQVGIGGHATIGGLGPLSRQWGSTLDHIVDMEVVLADGSITRANPQVNPDLFFALRGAGASFGIITEFVFRTQAEPVESVSYSFNLIVGKDNMIEAFSKWQKAISKPDLDRKLSTTLTITPLGMYITGTYFGNLAQYDATGFEAAISSGPAKKNDVIGNWLGTVLNWGQDVLLSVAGGISAPFYSKSLNFRPDTLIPEEGIKALFDYIDTADKGTLIWTVIFDLEGGAINDPPMASSAYGHRDTLFYIQTYGIGLGFLPQSTKTFLNGINDVIKKSMPGVEFGAYAGYVDPQLTDGQKQYWGSNYPRLQQVKSKFDPKDLFSNPQSVKLP